MEVDDDNSNDVIIMENVAEAPSKAAQEESRPLMQLFERLITNDNKQNTILTNAQIVSILATEFNINIGLFQNIEVDIYLNVVKKFLKDWPEWEEFDQTINKLKKVNAYKSIKKVLEKKYLHLKEYLTEILAATDTQIKEAKNKGAQSVDDKETENLVLEVYCNRKQLNNLIFNKPQKIKDYPCIFNVTESIPKQITVGNSIPLEAILNYPGVTITIDTKFFYYCRRTAHIFKYALVNSKNSQTEPIVPLDTNIMMKDTQYTETCNISQILKMLEQLLNMFDKTKYFEVLEPVMRVIYSDFRTFIRETVTMPGIYKQHTSYYPYERKLYTENTDAEADSNYDLYIHETISPMHQFSIHRFLPGPLTNEQVNGNWISIVCVECKFKMTTMKMFSSKNLIEHFEICHSEEKDWTCTKCNKSFKMAELALKKWYHKCDI